MWIITDLFGDDNINMSKMIKFADTFNTIDDVLILYLQHYTVPTPVYDSDNHYGNIWQHITTK